MPEYCFTSDKGKTIERMFTMSTVPPEVVENGVIYKRDFSAEHRGQARGGAGWPMVSFCNGVLPRQIPEAQKILQEHGCPTEYTPQGKPIWTSRNHKLKFAKVFHLNETN